MAKFYFDYQDAHCVMKDNVGEELPDPGIARKEALVNAGQMLKDMASRDLEGSIVIEVRDDDGPVLRVSATVEVASLRG
jgi:hypothetical protein